MRVSLRRVRRIRTNSEYCPMTCSGPNNPLLRTPSTRQAQPRKAVIQENILALSEFLDKDAWGVSLSYLGAWKLGEITLGVPVQAQPPVGVTCTLKLLAFHEKHDAEKKRQHGG